MQSTRSNTTLSNPLTTLCLVSQLALLCIHLDTELFILGRNTLLYTQATITIMWKRRHSDITEVLNSDEEIRKFGLAITSPSKSTTPTGSMPKVKRTRTLTKKLEEAIVISSDDDEPVRTYVSTPRKDKGKGREVVQTMVDDVTTRKKRCKTTLPTPPSTVSNVNSRNNSETAPSASTSTSTRAPTDERKPSSRHWGPLRASSSKSAITPSRKTREEVS